MVAAALLYFYFTYVDPAAPGGVRQPLVDLAVFVALTAAIVVQNLAVGRRFRAPVISWLARIDAGTDPATVPLDVRRRALNAPLNAAMNSLTGWLLAGVLYFPYQLWVVGSAQAVRFSLGIFLLGAPVASAMTFLVAEFSWRRRIPRFFPDGRIERQGVLRVPILARLVATFLVTAGLPPLLMVMADLSLERRFGHTLPVEVRTLWLGLLRTQAYIVAATGVVSIVMATLVARFIVRPVQALRRAMAQVAAGDLEARVPVRSTDELGELAEHFNDMLEDLRRAERAREIFGRYVSPAVAQLALERGVALGGELTLATAMFVDLRGFTALTQRTAPARVVELLNEYYAIVDRVCERMGGVITQFLGDGVVVVFGGPLQPHDDHPRRALRAAIALQRALEARNAGGGERLLAGIGLCTGDMIAGNVGAGDRVTYTIVGDAVNQAARLQVKTRDLGTPILLTESTRLALGDGDGVTLRSCGAVPLKGIAAPVEVYAVEA